jgi:hypothetical protein
VNCKNSYNNKLINDGQSEYDGAFLCVSWVSRVWMTILDIGVSNVVWLVCVCVCVRAIEIGGRSAAAVAAGRGQQQQQVVVQAPALRQPLSPVVMSVTQQQIYVEDSGNRLQVSNNNKASSFAKRSMTGSTSPPTSSPHPRLQGSENTTPMYSFDERRFSSIIGQTR